jgi:hypothetical protein
VPAAPISATPETMKHISQHIKLAVVSEDEARIIFRGALNDRHCFVAKLWPKSRVREELGQVRTAMLAQQQSAQQVWTMSGVHTHFMTYTLALTLPGVLNGIIYSELCTAQCCCSYCSTVQCCAVRQRCWPAQQHSCAKSKYCGWKLHNRIRIGHTVT